MPTQDEMQKMAAEGEAMLIAEWIELEMNDYVMNNAQTITKRIRTAAGWTDFVYRALRDLFGRVFPGELIGIEHGPGLEAELFPPARAKRTEEGLGLGMGFGD